MKDLLTRLPGMTNRDDLRAVTREPRYAEIAASMNMGAAVYRFQTSVSTGVPPGEVSPLRTVLQIRSTPAVNKVA